jgi:NitT/TauT family transport system substrate-binding protein
MRRIWIVAVAAVAALAAAACQRIELAQAAPTNPPMTVAAYYWPGMFWIDIANQKGWFAEAGLNVRVVDTNPDYYGSYQSVRNGTLDVQSFALFDLMKLNASGADLVAVLSGDSSSGAEKVVARAGIERMTDLAHKRLALPKGTYLEYIFEAAAKRAGLDPSRVTIVDVPGEKLAESLASGAVDAITAWEPYATRGRDSVKGSILFDTSMISGLDPQVYALRREFLEKRPEDVRKLLRVWQRTSEFMRKSPDEALAIVAAVNKQSVADVRAFTTLDRVLDVRDNELAFSFSSGFDSLHGAARQISDFMIARRITPKPIDGTRFLDASFVRELQQP